MLVRNFLPGDEAVQAAIYNAAAQHLPGFKPASVEEIRRRTSARTFDPSTRFYVEDGKAVVGYASFDPVSGRVGFPWCLPGSEHFSHHLFAATMRSLAQRKIPRAFTAYRSDWVEQLEYFEDQEFHKTREIINFTQSLTDLPTMFQRPLNITKVQANDLELLVEFSQQVSQLGTKYLAHFSAQEEVFVLRRRDGTAKGFGILLDDPTFADVKKLDPKTPCFRFGAFGSEGMATKRVNGLFSFLAPPTKEAELIGQDLLWYATSRHESNSFSTLAAQVPSDAKHLLAFYERYFVKQGSFPIYEREVGTPSRF